MHNSNLLCAVSRDLAMQQYYNPGQPIGVFNNGLFTHTSLPSLSVNNISTPQLYGYNNTTSNANSMDQRVANTISTYIPQTQTPLFNTNATINSLQPPQLQQQQNQETNSKESYEISTNITPKVTPNPVLEKPQEISSISTIPPNTILINKSTLIIVLAVIISIVIINLWMHQKKMEYILLSKLNSQQCQYKPTIQYQPDSTTNSVPYE